ncbi:MAG: hypothetical protein GY811_19220 [Myxococcales bacterium]|nr:hypothetical protein [Myxococcales bacterium]
MSSGANRAQVSTMSLSQKQDRALAVLLSGATCQEAAATAGVRPETISRWKRSPDFAAAITDGQAQLAELSADDLAELHSLAHAAIKSALTDDSVTTQLRAASMVVGRNGPQIADNNTAASAPELTLEDTIRDLLAAPRTLARAIACGVIPDSLAVRAALHDGAKQLASLASAPPTVVHALSEGSGPSGYLLGPPQA